MNPMFHPLQYPIQGYTLLSHEDLYPVERENVMEKTQRCEFHLLCRNPHQNHIGARTTPLQYPVLPSHSFAWITLQSLYLRFHLSMYALPSSITRLHNILVISQKIQILALLFQ